MRKDIAEKWIAALRSGKYSQTKGALHRTEPQGESYAGYCCLGVLCEVALAEGLGILVTEEDDGWMAYDAENVVLPPSVVAWAEMKGSRGKVYETWALTDLNDSGRTFLEIADLIEKEYETL